MNPPFPWFGGKRRWADDVIAALGPVDIYIEPFAGSLAVLLAMPQRRREIVCDTDGMICNFWRALRDDPATVAYYADWPTIHDDLTARRIWLANWRDEHADRLRQDAEYFNPQAAGWWVWCISNWIGAPSQLLERNERVPAVPAGGGIKGQGVQAQRLTAGIPRVFGRHLAGNGVQIQRKDIPPLDVGSGTRLLPWFRGLANRLARVIVLNRSWESALTPSMLDDAETGSGSTKGIFFDPPYRGTPGLYADGADAAEASYAWAVEHGNRFRIVYACGKNDFDVPAGWQVTGLRTYKGVHQANRQNEGDALMISPACANAKQMGLFS